MKESVGIGFIGTGFARRVQMPAFATCAKARLVSVASGSKTNAEAAVGEFNVPHATDNWRETVERDEVDIVCITTPPVYHKEMTLYAAKLGKHILCEKPMAMNVAEAEEMLAAADAAGVLALIDHELRFQPGRQRARDIIRNGEIGKIRHAKYNFRAPHRGDPKAAWNWWSDIEQGGGALGAINSHVIDSFRWLMDTEISTVNCQLQTHVKDRPYGDEMRKVTTDDEANMLLRFVETDNVEDATGLVSVSMTEFPEYVNVVEIFGSEGAIRIGHTGDVHLARRGGSDWETLDVPMAPAVEGIADTGFSRGFMALAPLIVEALIDGRTEVAEAATFADGLAVQTVLDAARESDRSGCKVSI